MPINSMDSYEFANLQTRFATNMVGGIGGYHGGLMASRGGMNGGRGSDFGMNNNNNLPDVRQSILSTLESQHMLNQPRD